MKTKYYVSIAGSIRILVLADKPMQAIAHSLSYMGFNDTTKVPKWMIEAWPDIIVDERGFRNYPMMGDEYPAIDENSIVIEIGEALDGVDECFRYYDPFCEHDKPTIDPNTANNYYFGLGEPE